jgi:cytochrome P450
MVWARGGQRLSGAGRAQPDAQKLRVSNPAPDSIINVDGTEHARLRRLVAGAFTERRIADFQPFIEQLAAPLPLAVRVCSSTSAVTSTADLVEQKRRDPADDLLSAAAGSRSTAASPR